MDMQLPPSTKNLIRNDPPEKTQIELNPFYLLAVSTRDNRQAIMAAAEEKSLGANADLCSRACSDLISSRNRLTAEMAWIPGISPKKAQELIAQSRKNPAVFVASIDMEPLALANLVSSTLDLLSEDLSSQEWVSWIERLANSSDGIKLDSAMKRINEDRSVSSFPEISSMDFLERELVVLKRGYAESVKRTLNRLQSEKLLAVVELLTKTSTNNGEKHAPPLVDDIIDAYHLEVEGMLQRRAEEVANAVDKIKTEAKAGEPIFQCLWEHVKKETILWNRVAKPIQIVFKSRGLEHDLSVHLARKIRSLSVYVANEYGFLDAAKNVTTFLSETFSLLPEFALAVNDDATAIGNLLKKRDEAKEREKEWADSITREFEFGVLFKKKFQISPHGISWNGKVYPLDKITRVRWGGTRHSVNGIPTGTTYKVAFGDNMSEAVVDVSGSEIYKMIIDSMWKAICIRLMTGLLQSLKAGEKIRFGDAVIDDLGVELMRHKFFSSERSYWTWNKVKTWSSNGFFVIGSAEDKKSHSQMSYMNDQNIHVLEACISAAFKNFKGRLSALLD